MKEDKKRMAWIWSMYNHNEGSVVELKEITQQFSKDILYEMKDDVSMLVWIAAGRGDKDMTRFSYILLVISSISIFTMNLEILPYIERSDVASHPRINIHLENKNGNDAYYQAIVSDKEDCARELRSHPHFK
eukprot:CAMPEP_0173142152 /NCGR_PEP_ID=MMETSP1105-20130129/5922_1 /TAXON_ID=2985 /ORGANISM="Ochromonas sp., Strain BG-1" /LENGTH=131 /DNA_ID=CAMNT_0014055497 /DNA_START=407 /DNA_END=802 /DNA_ORIENTATION=-